MCPKYLSKLIILKNVAVNLWSENNLILPKYIKVEFDKNTFNYNSLF